MMYNGRKEMQNIASIVLTVLLFLISLPGCDQEKVRAFFDDYRKEGGSPGDIRSLAILSFSDTPWDDQFTESLAFRLRLTGYLTVTDPRETRKILQQKGLPFKGEPGAEDGQRITEALGVDGLIFGSASLPFRTVVRYRDPLESQTYSAFPVWGCCPRSSRLWLVRDLRPVPYLHREGTVSLTLRFFDGKAGKQRGSAELTTSYLRDFDHFYFKGTKPGGTYYFDRAFTAPMPSDLEMTSMLADRLLERMMNQFFPDYIMGIRNLEKDIPGTDRALSGKWKEARSLWEKDAESPQDAWKALVNLGIYHERNGEPRKALSCYQKALSLKGSDEQIARWIAETKAAADMRTAIIEPGVPLDGLPYTIIEIKEDGRIYLDGGEEKGIRPGDQYMLARRRITYDREPALWYSIGTITIEKVFQGVCQGIFSRTAGGSAPRKGDRAGKRGS